MFLEGKKEDTEEWQQHEYRREEKYTWYFSPTLYHSYTPHNIVYCSLPSPQFTTLKTWRLLLLLHSTQIYVINKAFLKSLSLFPFLQPQLGPVQLFRLSKLLSFRGMRYSPGDAITCPEIIQVTRSRGSYHIELQSSLSQPGLNLSHVCVPNWTQREMISMNQNHKILMYKKKKLQ